MKKLSKIALECQVSYIYLYRLILSEKIIPARKDGRFIYFDIYQEDLIHHLLYFAGKITEITLESKMNIPETFEEFKKRTYGKK